MSPTTILEKGIAFLFALFCSAVLNAGQAFAVSNTFAVAPDTGPAVAEVLQLPAGSPGASRVELPANALLEQQVAWLKRANSDPESHIKVLQIGVGRDVPALPEARSASLRWQRVDRGAAAQWSVASQGARALRIGLEVANLPLGAEIRFAGEDGAGTVYGPFRAEDLFASNPIYWSPVLQGERAIVEVFVPEGTPPGDVALEITRISHLFASLDDPHLEANIKVGESGPCEVDLICRSATDSALAAAGQAVARMAFTSSTGGTGYCTGTLLNPRAGPLIPYFYSANHCISTQSVATTLTTHWFYQRSVCGSGSPSFTQLAGGATLLYNNATSDALLLRLNGTPPAGAVYAGWDSATVTNGTPIVAIHHPATDVKKVSLGTIGGFSAYGGGTGSTHIIALWNGTSTGVTEGGSSGSGIFTAVGSPASEYQLRGGLHGGPSSCSATGTALRDYYSRFDQAYPSIAQYLNPTTTCSYSLSPTSHSLAATSGSASFTVNTSPGCAWTAMSNASWITTSSSGSGSGSVTYSVSANTGASRGGTISVGGQTFSVTQAGGTTGTPGTSLLNPGFENGATSWTQSGSTIITNNASAAHSGGWYAWLGGYHSANDVLYQDVAIPASATSAAVRFWYHITTQETTTTTPYDRMVVTVENPSTGAVLATLVTFSNLTPTSGWVQSPSYDITAFKGQTVRLKFAALTDSSLITNFRVDDVSLNIVASTNPPRLVNIATRMQVLTGDNVLIGGFIIGGSAPKTVVVRARGPSLAAFGVPGTLADPVLNLYSGQTVIGSNDDWRTASNSAAVTASGFAPSQDLESAILTTLNPGPYTAIVSGYQGGTGVGIIEVFEVDALNVPLINIATRGQVLTGDNVMIGGFVIQGDGPKTVVVRARGPSLVAAGVPNALSDPMLELYSGQTVLASNDDYQTSTNLAALVASGFAPADGRESAILVTLPPGGYTAIVRGYQGATGVGIVEVFTVP